MALRELSIKDLENFAKTQKLGKLVGVNYRENKMPARYSSEFSYEPFSIDLSVENTNGKTLTYTFSKHGLANIHDGSKRLYKLDSEERFSAENPELSNLTIAFIKLMISKQIKNYAYNELKYRRESFGGLKNKYEHFLGIKAHYNNQVRFYTKLEGEDSTRAKFSKQEFDRYSALCDSLKNLKAFQTKCITMLEKQKMSEDESNK